MITSLVRNTVAAGAAAFAVSFSMMDANPSLYLFDKFIVTDERMKNTFQGKTMWITGASGGIGAEIAIQLSQSGCNLILSARSADKLNSVAEICRSNSARKNFASSVTVIPFDITSSPDQLEGHLETIIDVMGDKPLDFVFLNAGRGQLRPASDTDNAITEEVFRLNTFAPITLTQLMLKNNVLSDGRGSHLIVTSSVGGRFGVPLSASYAASKHALHGYYDSLRSECPWLRIDLVCPGPVDTEFHSNHIGGSSIGKKSDGVDNDVMKATPTSKEPKKLKMSVSRCAQLIVSSCLLKATGERWIAEQPTLFGLYLKQHFPSLFQILLSKIGPVRVQAWKEGKDLYDPESWKQSKKPPK